MLELLQKNGEWMSAIVLAIFTAVQLWYNIKQYRNEKRRKKSELYQDLLKIFLPYPGSVRDVSDICSKMLVYRPNIETLLGKNAKSNIDNLYDLIFDLSRSKSDIDLCIHNKRGEYIVRVCSLTDNPKNVEKMIKKIKE